MSLAHGTQGAVADPSEPDSIQSKLRRLTKFTFSWKIMVLFCLKKIFFKLICNGLIFIFSLYFFPPLFIMGVLLNEVIDINFQVLKYGEYP